MRNDEGKIHRVEELRRFPHSSFSIPHYNDCGICRILSGQAPQPVKPYPAHLVQRLKLRDGSPVTIRPIRPDDAAIEQAFVRNLSNESRYYRFMDTVRELNPRMLSHFTQVDYDRHMALIAVIDHAGAEAQVGVARYVADDDRNSGEFAIVIADAWQHRGLGTSLMQALIASARDGSIRLLHGDVLASNHKMLAMMVKLGFRKHFNEQDPRVVRVEKEL
jgi:acetyltransferase